MVAELTEQLVDLHTALLHVVYCAQDLVPVLALGGMQSLMGGIVYQSVRLFQLLVAA